MYATRALTCGCLRLLPAGKTVKCADVGSDLKQQFDSNYKTCVDKEVLQGSSSGSGVIVSWNKMDNMDVAGKEIASGGKPFTEVRGSSCPGARADYGAGRDPGGNTCGVGWLS
jgi:hypothetical protein